MAMKMSGEVRIPAERNKVWFLLNDAEVLRECIPGCESLEKVSDTEFIAIAVNKIGPVKAKFKGRVTLSELDPPKGYRISGQGDGGIAGFATGSAEIALVELDGETLLSYNVDSHIGGKLAQLGQRLIDGAAKKIADGFFAKFSEIASAR